MKAQFDRFANRAASWLGHPSAFLLASLFIVIWGIAGPFCGFSDAWQLSANTITTIVTFLMMFLLQNTGNRTIEEMHDRLRGLENQNDLMLKIIKGDIVVKDGMMFDYSDLTDEELAATDPHAEELLRNSTLVWQSKEL
ncbi:MAG: low affinity iron permease family protein [Oxalobacteraceae bacterium]|nr:MAG: low affinity iron permease family protein [Oxalobacteraceae bacterium]